MEGRCMKCGEQREMKDVQMTMTKRGGYMAKGKCAGCKVTTVCKIMSKDNALKAIESGEATKAF